MTTEEQNLDLPIVEEPQTGGNENDFNTELYNFFKENSVITVDDEFDGSDSAIQDLIKKSQEQQVNARLATYLEALPPENRAVVQAAMNNQSLDQFFQSAPQAEPTFDVTTEEGMAATVMQDFKEKGMADEDVKNLIDLYKDNGTLEAKATAIKTAREQQKEAQRLENERLRQEELQQQEQEAQKLKTGIVSIMEKTGWEQAKNDAVQELIFTSKDGMPKFQQRLVEILSSRDANNLVKLAEFVHYYKDGKLDVDSYRGVQQKKEEKNLSSINALKSKFTSKGGNKQPANLLENVDLIW